jgi:nucleoside phosphorylase
LLAHHIIYRTTPIRHLLGDEPTCHGYRRRNAIRAKEVFVASFKVWEHFLDLEQNIDRALRDEGTSYHYAAPSEYSEAAPQLIATVTQALAKNGVIAVTGSTWTTDAPFRETTEAIAAARSKGVLAVEMEAAALYAFARAKKLQIICLAHVTNAMAQAGHDFDKGEADGSVAALRVLEAIIAVARS